MKRFCFSFFIVFAFALLVVSPVGSQTHTVDGIKGVSEWPLGTLEGTDLNEPTIADQWDVGDVHMQSPAGSQNDTLFVGWDAYDDILIDNEDGLRVECLIYFDRDENGIADARIYWQFTDDPPGLNVVTADTSANNFSWFTNGNGIVAWQDTFIEFAVEREHLGFRQGSIPIDNCIPFYLIFDNGNTGTGSEDDRFLNSGWTDFCDPYVPIELMSFQALPTNAGVELTWETASETENLGFMLYRSKGASWSTVTPALIEAMGSPRVGHVYYHADTEIERDWTYWYRLTDVSTDGVETSHGPVRVFVPPLSDVLALDAPYPNPVRDDAQVRFNIPVSGVMSLVLYDVAGREMQVIAAGETEAGAHSAQLNRVDAQGHRISAGNYVLRLTSSAGETSRRIIIAD